MKLAVNNVDVLLIGNGPAALSKEMGPAIDSFEGIVIRFNNYTIKGFEKYVGTRTDCWVTTADYRPSEETHKYRYYMTQRKDEQTISEVKRLGAVLLSDSWDDMPDYPLSSAALMTNQLLNNGCKVFLWGFDFMSLQRPHHYNNDGCDRGPWHDEFKEWIYFHNLHEQGKIAWFGLDTTKETSPIYRQPVPCGNDKDISWYRVAAHNAWYNWFGSLSRCKSILDVGAGMCEGMKVLDKYSRQVRGIEVDERLLKLDERLSLETLDSMPNKSVDVITCVDVIEHVIEDRKLMDNMKRIARDAVFVTTPCYTRSRCGNIAHCREYSIPQFMNFFGPSEIYSASPDGSIHLTRVLKKQGNIISNYSLEGPDNAKSGEILTHRDYVPVSTKFNFTVDKEEWAHIAACFYGEALN